MSKEAKTLSAVWAAYVAAEASGIRRVYLKALDEFLSLWESTPSGIRDAEMPGFAVSLAARDSTARIRGPLLDRVVIPVLLREYLSGSAAAAVELARLQKSSLGSHRCWKRHGVPSTVELLNDALRRDPSCEDARMQLVERHLDYIRFTLHELPTGVLYGMDGATVAECDDLTVFLEEVHRLMTPLEIEQHRALLESASFHYPMYRQYLLSSTRSGYEAYFEHADFLH